MFKLVNNIFCGIFILTMLIPLLGKAQNAPLPTINGFNCGDSYESVLSTIKSRGYNYKVSTGNIKIITVLNTNVLLHHAMEDDNLFDSKFIFQSDNRLKRVNVDLNNEGRAILYKNLNNCTRVSIYNNENCFLLYTNEYWRAFNGLLGKETYAGPTNPNGSYTQRISWNYKNGIIVLSRSINWQSRRKYSIDIRMALECDNLPTQKSIPQQIDTRPKQSNTSQGSGIIISLENGIIATNYHVVENAQLLRVIIKGSEVDARILSYDEKSDLALIAIKPSVLNSFQSIPFMLNTTPKEVGESIYTLGYPLSSVLGVEIKLTDGIISSRTGYQGDVSTYQISAPIQPGSSGGALFDKNGTLVGITNAGVESAQNVGYAIKASYLKNLIDSSPYSFAFPKNNRLSGLSLSEQVKRVSPYIVMIIAGSDNKTALNNTVILELKEKMDWNSKSLCKIHINSRVEVLEVIGGWAKIRYNGQVGFIASSWLTQSAPQKTSNILSQSLQSSNSLTTNNKQGQRNISEKSRTTKESTVPANVNVTDSKANKIVKLKNNFEIQVKESANSGSKTIAKVPTRGTIEVLGTPSGDFVRIKISGKTGFIPSKWITQTSLHE